MQRGILLVASGTMDADARRVLARFDELAAARFPGIPIRWAYTAGPVRNAMNAAGLEAESPADALARMRAGGITHVAAGTLHVVAGMEYDGIKEAAALAMSGPGSFERIIVGTPLLASYEDLRRTADAVLAELPSRTGAEECVILIGHGNRRHPADLAYVAAAQVFRELDARVFLGTVRGNPDLADVVVRCIAAGVQRAYLVPFTTLAGRTTRDDMTGDGPDTLRSLLAQSGIESEPVLRGLAEYGDLAAIWLDHLGEAVRGIMPPAEEDCPIPR